MLNEAQNGKIKSFRAKVKITSEIVVQIDHYGKTPYYDGFANYWSSWSARKLWVD